MAASIALACALLGCALSTSRAQHCRQVKR